MDANRIPFDALDEQRIASAATWGMVVSITSLATGALSLILMVTQLSNGGWLGGRESLFLLAAFPLVQTVVTLLINVMLLRASLDFRKVALTDEADQAFLLQGFRNLRVYFMLQVLMYLLMVGGMFLLAFIN